MGTTKLSQLKLGSSNLQVTSRPVIMYRKTAEWSNLLFVYKKLDELFIVPVSLSDEVGCEVFMYNTVHTLVAVDVYQKVTVILGIF